MENLKVINGNWKHHAVLADIGAHTFYETFRPHNTEEDMQMYISLAYSISAIKQNLSKTNVHYFLGYLGNQDAGYVKLIENPKDIKLEGRVMELEKIYLRKAFQGSGLATSLMNLAIEKSKELGFEKLYLGVWQENERAITFYKKMGFEVFDTRKFQLGSRWCEDYLMYIRL